MTSLPGPAATAPTQADATPSLSTYGGPPVDVALRPLDGDVLDETAFRRFMARHAAAQALSAQRTEFYLRSMRLYVVWWFWLTVIGAVIGGIWLGIALSEAESSGYPY
ncbi:hypothetical protein [Blastococcus sp. SYSU D00813]